MRKDFYAKAVFSERSGFGEQQEPQRCSTFGGTSPCSALGSASKPTLVMEFTGSGAWAGCPPVLLISVNSNKSQDVPTFECQIFCPIAHFFKQIFWK